MSWMFTAIQGITLIWLWVRRYPRPWFMAALALWTVQSVNVSLPHGPAWIDTWWKWPEIALLLATVASVVETKACGTRYVARPFQRLQIRIAAAALPTCAVGIGVFLIPPASFQECRMWVWWGLALALIVGELLMWLEGVERPRAIVAHSMLLLTVMLAHAVLSSFLQVSFPNISATVWWSMHAIFRLVIGCCCVGWAILPLIPAGSRPTSSARHQSVGAERVHAQSGA